MEQANNFCPMTSDVKDNSWFKLYGTITKIIQDKALSLIDDIKDGYS